VQGKDTGQVELPAWHPASRAEWHAVLGAALATLVALFALLPFARHTPAIALGFMPAQQGVLAVAGVVCSVLLLGHYRLLRAPSLLWLAGGQLVTAVVAVLHLASVPGLFSLTGWPSDDAGTGAWLSLFWHAGLPAGVIGYALGRTERRPAEGVRQDIAGTLAVATLGVAAALLLAGALQGSLPALMRGTRPTAAFILLVSGVWMLGLLALVALWNRETRSRLDLWLGLALVAWVAGTALGAVFSTSRFDLGAYAGGMFALLSQGLLLGVLLWQQWWLDSDRVRAHAALGEQAVAMAHLQGELAAACGQLAPLRQALEDSREARAEVLSGMSHELRAPLNAIIGFTEMLKDGLAGELSAQQRGYLGHVHQSGHHLLALINDVLELSRIDAGRAELALEPVDLDAVLDDALAQAGALALGRQVRLRREVPATLGLLQADARRLRQMLDKLLVNAITFTPEGGEVTLRAGRVDRVSARDALPGFPQGVRLPLADHGFEQFVQVSVSDTGAGLSGEDAARLFTPFTRVAGRARRGVDGTGLGLAMVGRLAVLHGGSAALTSAPGQGSCFSLWLPWRAEPAQRLPAPLRHAAHAEGPLALVVEDDDKAATLIRMQLEAEGFRVHHVSSAEAALRLAERMRPDVITLDIELPGMDGWDLMALLKDVPEWEGVPVVVVSVAADKGRGFSLGAAAVLEKPVGREALAKGLARLGLIPDASRDVTVLVIDDDANAVEILASFLHQAGYVVLCAFGGQEGIELARRYRPDVIALDLEMPEVNGFDVVEALKRDADTAHIPIVVVTSRQLGAEDRRALNGHILDIVDKTEFSHGRFIGEVRRALSRPATQAAAGVHQGSPSQ
jgi:signal transduction histidine kinase/CheY-like chemotaxis protein